MPAAAAKPEGARPPEENEIVTLVVVDDHSLLRDVVRLECAQEARIRIVGEAADGPSAVQTCLDLRPDVVLLDLYLPGIDGFEVARRLRARGSRSRILVLSGRSDANALFAAAQADVQGYLEKGRAAGRLCDAVLAVAAGERVFSDEQERVALARLGDVVARARARARLAASVSARERDVLVLLSRGMTTRDMARQLHLSPRTVESHITRLYRKLGAASRVEAVTKAGAAGLLDLHEVLVQGS